MKHCTFKAAGISGGIKFRMEGELHIEDHESAVDEAAKCCRDSLGDPKAQFSRLSIKQIPAKTKEAK